ncbi:MAG: hypothetical protein MJE63_03125 [Proteobacteria bacterium]|nr:hypothetical protein [Pseudomonadota bacterium]
MNSYTKVIAQVKSLTVWWESSIQSTAFFAAFISVVIVLLSWPDKMLYKFVLNGEIPKTFSIVSISIVLLISLVSLVFGRAEARKTLDGLSQLPETSESPRENELWFFAILFFRFVMHTILLSVLFFPMLLPGVAISRLSWVDLAKTIAIIYSTAFSFRVFGFSVYLFLNKRDILDTFITSLFFLSFFLFTAIWLHFINPLVLMYHLNLSREVIAPVPMSAFSCYHLVLLALTLLLGLICFLKIHFKLRSK